MKTPEMHASGTQQAAPKVKTTSCKQHRPTKGPATMAAVICRCHIFKELLFCYCYFLRHSKVCLGSRHAVLANTAHPKQSAAYGCPRTLKYVCHLLVDCRDSGWSSGTAGFSCAAHDADTSSEEECGNGYRNHTGFKIHTDQHTKRTQT
jgi:hypothetical protein